MADKILIHTPPIGRVAKDTQIQRTPARERDSTRRPSFDDILHREIGRQSIRFSGHAEMRLKTRDISLSESDLDRLALAMDRAQAKGARESLILMDRLALVVSIKNRTVITAVDGEHMKENVFTNIDSAVIV